jgi:methionine-rich copper-binding protein CopC
MALVLGMMACSSITPEAKTVTAPQDVSIDFTENDIEQSFVKMNLIAQQSDSFNTNDSDKAMQQTAHMMKTFKKSNVLTQPADNSANLIKTLVNGKYSYLAKSMANTASFGFWITPN